MYIRKFVLLIAALSIVTLVHGDAQAQLSPEREAAAKAEAKNLINGCWTISKEMNDRGSTADMRRGALKSVLCLEGVILDLTGILFETRYLSREKAQERLKTLRFAYGRFYWDIHNEHRGCRLHCGTMYQLFHLDANASILEKMVQDMVDKRYQYEIDQ